VHQPEIDGQMLKFLIFLFLIIIIYEATVLIENVKTSDEMREYIFPEYDLLIQPRQCKPKTKRKYVLFYTPLKAIHPYPLLYSNSSSA